MVNQIWQRTRPKGHWPWRTSRVAENGRTVIPKKQQRSDQHMFDSIFFRWIEADGVASLLCWSSTTIVSFRNNLSLLFRGSKTQHVKHLFAFDLARKSKLPSSKSAHARLPINRCVGERRAKSIHKAVRTRMLPKIVKRIIIERQTAMPIVTRSGRTGRCSCWMTSANEV